MKLHLDDDTASGLLAKLLRKAGHDVQLPVDIGIVGQSDPVHLTRAIRDGRVCMTKNYDDYWLLHALLMQAKGQSSRHHRDSPRERSKRDLLAQGHRLGHFANWKLPVCP